MPLYLPHRLATQPRLTYPHRATDAPQTLFPPPQEQEAWRLNPQSLEEFVALWSEYDDGSGSIAPPDLEALLLRWGLQPLLSASLCRRHAA